ncbi:MAG: Asp-tRNA(Asn)/Glu-tRNA(Gln) amidotransferase subunit GatB [Brevinematia bacterium]
MDYEVVIGLEVHVQLNTKSKIFCGCSTEFGSPPNTHVCPVCMGHPGVLPVLNREVLNKAIKAGLALNGEILLYSKFDRKNYFYPDLPKGYQISQFDLPIMKNGHLLITLSNGETKIIGITRIHMEEDAGKLVHGEGESVSYVDFNRAGVPLLEIVSEPDIRSSEEAYLYLKEIRNIMKYIDVSDVNMEEGSLRCDANVSIRPKGEKRLGTKVEIKNMNSFNSVRRAIDYEIARQIEVKESGGEIIQETRLYDATQNKTFSMRSKEESHDYRYFPEPDIPPIILEQKFVEEIKASLPELPFAKKKRFSEEYKLPLSDAELLSEEKELADYFEKCVKISKLEPKKISNWLQSEVLAVLNEKNISISNFAENYISAENLVGLLSFIEDGTISGKIAKQVFEEMVETKKTAKEIIESKGLKQVTDNSEIEKWIEEVIAKNPKEVEKYKQGNEKLIGFFVGEVMRLSKGKANPKLVNEILRKKLS